MMQDYGRTQELVAAANNSAGAADKQYGKTLDSLQTSLTRLKNAWDEFSMSFADNDFIKGAVDALSKLLEIINKITGNSGLLKLAVIIPAMTGADKAVTAFRNNLITQDDGSKGNKKGLRDTIKGTVTDLLQGRKKKKATALNLSEVVGKVNPKESFNKYSKQRKDAEEKLARTASDSGSFETIQKYTKLMDEANQKLKNFNLRQYEATEIKNASIKATQEAIDAAKNENKELSYSTIIMAAVNTARKSGISTAWKQWEASTAVFLANKMEAAGLIEVGTASKVAEGGLKAVGAAAWASLGPYVIFAAAVTALITLMYLLAKAAQKTTLAAKIKEAEETTKRAEEAAQRASEAYDELLDKKDAYNENQKALDALVVGTKEWKEQLIKCNDEVIELLDKYPDLAQYLTKDAQGRLSLNASGWDAIESRASAAKAGTRSAAAISASEERSLKLRQQGVETGYKYFEWTANDKAKEVAYVYQETTKEEAALAIVNAYAELLDEKGPNLDDSTLQEFANAWYVTVDSLKEATNDTLKYNQALKAEQKTREASYQAMFESGLNEEDATSTIGQNMAAAYARIWANEDQVTKAINEYKTAYGEKVLNRSLPFIQDLAEEYNVTLSGNNHLNLQKLYAAMTSSTLADVKDQKLSDEQMLDEIVKQLVGRDFTNNTAKYAAHLRGVPEAMAKGVSGFLAGSVTTLSNKQWKGIMGNNADEAAKLMADTLGISVEEFYKEFYNESPEAFEKAYKQAKNERQAALNSALEAVAGVGLTDKNFDSNLSPEAKKSLADNLALMLASNMEEASKYDWTGAMDSLGLDEDQLNSFVMTMGAFNWSDAAAWDNFAESIKEIYPNISSNALDQFVENMKKYNNAIVDMSWEEVNKRMTTLNKTLHDIDSGEQTRTFTEETYNALKKAVPELANEFAQNYDGSWFYLGDSMETLRKSVDNATEILKNRITLTEKQLNAIDIAKNTSYHSVGSLIGTAPISADWAKLANSSNFVDKRTALQNFINKANKEDVDLNIGIEGLSNGTVVDSLDDDKVTQIVSDIAKLIAKEEDLIKEQRENTKTEYFQATAAQSALNAAASALYSNEKYLEERATTFEGDTALTNAAMKGRYEGYKAKLIESGWQDADFTEYNKRLDTIKNNARDLAALDWLNQFIYNTNKDLAINEFTSKFQDTYKNLQDAFSNYTGSDSDLDKTIKDNVLRMFGLEGLSGTDRDQAIAALLAMSRGDPNGYFALLALDKTNKKLTTTYLDQNGNEQIYTLEGMTFRVLTGNQDLESSYSWLINQNEQINALIRQREFLEKKYQMALEDTNYSYTELQQLTKNQFALLEKENTDYLETIANQSAKIDELYRDASEAAKSLVRYDPSTGALVMSSDYDSAPDTLREEADRLYNKIKEATDAEWDAVSKLQDNVSLMRELRDRGRDQFIELENTIRDGIVTLYEKNIEAMENSNNAITEANSKLLESMRKSIDEDRQARDNTKTEQDIEDQQRRLAYLQQDSSGANQQEILELQKSIDEAQQSYQDSLVDQALQKLEDANQIAEEQRQEQIEIAREQLQYIQDNGLLWEQIGKLSDEEKIRIWKASSDFGSMSPEEQDLKLEQFKASMELANSWLKEDGSLDTSINKFTDAINRFVEVFGEMPTDTNSAGVDAFNATNLNTLKQLVEWLEDPNEGWPVIHDAVERSYGTAPISYATNGGTINNDSHDTYTYYIEATDRTDEEVEEIMARVITKQTGHQPVLLS